jgi:hypothetical protein
VNPLSTRLYNLETLFNPYLGAVINFLGATRPEATVNDGKNNRTKKLDVGCIKRAVDKDA